jgi:hypothetical protein
MPRGGARVGSGRRPLWKTKEAIWIVRAVRCVFEDTQLERQLRWERKNLSRSTFEASEDVRESIQTLKKNRSQKQASIERIQLLLEDISMEFDLGNVPRGSFAPAPSQRDKKRAYEIVAVAASEHFQKRITRQQVERAVNKWLELEKRLNADVV